LRRQRVSRDTFAVIANAVKHHQIKTVIIVKGSVYPVSHFLIADHVAERDSEQFGRSVLGNTSSLEEMFGTVGLPIAVGNCLSTFGNKPWKRRP
jgi:hypothetical protein